MRRAMLAARALAYVSLPVGMALVQAAGQAGSQPAANAQRLTAGPTYTSGEGKNDPKFPDVDVVFTLTGADGNPIEAKPGDLKLFSQGSELATASSIRTFDKTGYGLAAILALDASGSMRGAPIKAIHATIARFVNQARSQDRVAVVTFADETKVDVPFGSTQDAIKQELETVEPRGKFTRLYDGLLDALNLFNDKQPKRRQLVVISDGHDEGSQHTLADVVVRAKQLNAVIDGIGLAKDRGAFLGILQQLAEDTGGTYRRAMTAQDLDRFIDQGIQANRATPVAAFRTEHLAADNAMHSTQLRWKPGNLTAAAFVTTPQRSVWRNPVVWVLGGCFLAGLALLAISWFGSKPLAKEAAAVSGGIVGAPRPVAPPAPPPFAAPAYVQTPTVLTPRQTPTRFEATSGGAARTPTKQETLPPPVAIAPRAGKPAPTSIEPIAPVPGRGGQTASAGAAATPARDLLGKERGKTKLAAFFDAPEKGPYALIRVKNGDMAGAAIPMTSTVFSLGALAGNQLILPGDPTISGHHLKLFWEGSILKLEDLNSTNGTFLNAARVAPGRQLLRPGDEVRLGQTVLVLDRV